MTLSCELPTPPPSTSFPILKKMIACFVSLSFFFLAQGKVANGNCTQRLADLLTTYNVNKLVSSLSVAKY